MDSKVPGNCLWVFLLNCRIVLIQKQAITNAELKQTFTQGYQAQETRSAQES